MKILKITPGAVQLNTLSQQLSQHFGSKYEVTDNGKNEITVAASKSIGCKVVLSKKRLLINGTFPTPGRMLLALGILIVGGIIIPMAVYMILYKSKFEAIENEVWEFVRTIS